ncbi:hypothetical protein OSSY52_05740 [Tepiditoga spiralis]|uniref:Uncharacterized protein n=1 Tax=Tepiditoga spiralis TaxID=2108365 RepID=A0A7G1G6H8_9BACT|nr:hypothetical protein [Tepiditoga spiralis]BBE30433.1 hypothetical protein OSSY52_05740 [Tepiditoga spiralis]
MKEKLSKLSIYSIILFFAFFSIFLLFIKLGERGGQTFFSNLKLTIPFLLAAASGIFSFFTGIISILKNKERSILVFISTGIGAFILFWVSAEILFPH